MATGNRLADGKRLTDRARVNHPCSFLIGDKTWFGTITDLSLGGAFIESAQCSPNEDQQLEVRFESSEREVRLSGRVRHSGRFLVGYYNTQGFGVEFDTASKCRVAMMLQDKKTAPMIRQSGRMTIQR